MSRAIVMAFHLYTPFGKQFYKPIFDFQLSQLTKYKDEFDMWYILDSTWNFSEDEKWLLEKGKAKVIKVNPSLRYYDAYKQVLPQVKEDLVLFMDNDMIVYKKGIIKKTFTILEEKQKQYLMAGNYGPLIREKEPTEYRYDVVTIMDTIGTYKTSKLKLGNKFCPYWFATRKDLLMNYLDVEWGPNMPYYETLGGLTEEMLADDVKVYEWEEDKSNIYLGDAGGILEAPSPGKNLGYYHIRAGSTPAYLLATKKYGDMKTYRDYIEKQPKQEYLRQLMWYFYMVIETGGYNEIKSILDDVGISIPMWTNYYRKFKEYHGLS